MTAVAGGAISLRLCGLAFPSFPFSYHGGQSVVTTVKSSAQTGILSLVNKANHARREQSNACEVY